MKRTLLSCVGFLLLSLLFGCSSDAASATQIIVTVESDYQVPTELDRVTLGVSGGASAPMATADLTMKALPRSVGFTYEGGELGPFVITATGYLGATKVVEKSVRTSFVKGKDVELTLRLETACRQVFCSDGSTCEAGRCDSISGGPGDDGGAGDLDAGAAGGDAGGGTGPVSDGGSGVSDAGTTGGADAGTTGSDAGAGTPPTCTISLPETQDYYQANQNLTLRGTCTDPESGTLTTGLVWTSTVDGQLGQGSEITAQLEGLGAHTIRFCGTDPNDNSVSDCDEVMVQVTAIAQPHVAITSIKQSNSTNQPFRNTSAISFVGEGTGAGIVLTWSDNIRGSLGSGTMVSMSSPDVGKHTVRLIGKDRDDAEASVSQTYTVLPPSQDALVEAYGSANTVLAGNGGTSNVVTVGVDGEDRVYAAANGKLYGLAADQANPSATLVVDAPPLPGSVQDEFIAEGAGLAYLGTSAGLTVCSYSSMSGIGATCNSFSGNDFPDNSVRAVLRMVGTDSDPYLLVGTEEGLLIADAVSGGNAGDTAINGRRVNALLAFQGLAWVATDEGFYRYNPATDQSQRFGTDQGAPSNTLTSLSVDSAGNLWVGSSNGLARFVPGANTWTIWRTQAGLVSNSINAVAVASTLINGVTRDVIWIATNAGVSRFDPTIDGFMNLTTADGLPSNTVRDVVVLSDGTKVFATAAGLARYEGP